MARDDDDVDGKEGNLVLVVVVLQDTLLQLEGQESVASCSGGRGLWKVWVGVDVSMLTVGGVGRCG